MWALPPATTALLNKRLARIPPADRATALLLRGLHQWCIAPPAARAPAAASPQAGARQQEQPVHPNQRPPHASSASSASDSRDGSGDLGTNPQPSAAAQQVHPSAGRAEDETVVVPWECTDQALLQLLRSRDPTGYGLGDDVEAVRLLRSLLQWAPEARPTAREALQSPYFWDTL